MLVCREGTAQTASFGILFKSFSPVCTLSTEEIVRMSHHTVCFNNALDISWRFLIGQLFLCCLLYDKVVYVSVLSSQWTDGSFLNSTYNVCTIQYEDQLISPKQFVHMSGKATLKDWKRAIRMGGVMLRWEVESTCPTSTSSPYALVERSLDRQNAYLLGIRGSQEVREVCQKLEGCKLGAQVWGENQPKVIDAHGVSLPALFPHS